MKPDLQATAMDLVAYYGGADEVPHHHHELKDAEAGDEHGIAAVAFEQHQQDAAGVIARLPSHTEGEDGDLPRRRHQQRRHGRQHLRRGAHQQKLRRAAQGRRLSIGRRADPLQAVGSINSPKQARHEHDELINEAGA